MNLSKVQIYYIDAYLVKKGIKYLDVKLEMVDHIASEIETKTDQEDISFNDALLLVMKKWQYQFNDSRSFWTGIAITYPKIVLDKMLLNMKIASIYTFVFMLIGLSFFAYFQKELNEVLQSFSAEIELVCFLLLTLIVTIIIMINIKKQSTTFSFFINRSASIIPIGFFVLLLDEEVVQLQFFYVLILFFQFAHMLKNYYLHRNFIKKHQIS
jgi:hypothetical protein